jgi:hypothetical protein
MQTPVPETTKVIFLLPLTTNKMLRQLRLFWLGPVLLLCLMCGSNFSAWADSKIERLIIYPDDMLILKFTMGQRILLSENIIAYPNLFSTDDDTVHSSIALSLQEFVTAIEFPITVKPAEGQAVGWFIDQQRRFDLDLSQGSVKLAAQQKTVNPQLIQWYNDDIFVDIEVLGQWFGLTFNYDAGRQTLNMSAKEVLPFQQKWAREAQRKKLNQWLENNAQENRSRRDLPLFTSPYGPLSLPDLKLFSSVGYQYQSEGVREGFYQYNGSINHDLLYQSTKWYFKGDNANGLSDVRLTMGRQSDLKDLAGMGLSDYRFGDTYSFAVPLVSNSVLGSGFSVSSFDLGFRSQSNAVTIRGAGQSGWDIELYRNSALVNAGKVDSDGTYEFVDVPLTSGNNEVKLIFYGPRGEKEEKTERYYMHPDLARKGQLSWRASWHQHNKQLFDVNKFGRADENQGKPRFVLQSEYGLNDSLSLSASWVELPLARQLERHQYFTVGSRFILGDSYFRQQYIQNLTNQSHALELFGSTEFGDSNIFGKYQQFSEQFVSEYSKAQNNPIKSQTHLNFHQNFSSHLLSHLSLGLKAKLERFHNGQSSSQYTFNQAFAKGSLSMTNELSYVDNKLQGSAVFNMPSVFDIKFRGTLQYRLKPGIEAQSLLVSGEYPLSNQFHLSTEINQVIQPSRSSRLGLRLTRQFDKFNLDLAAQYQSGGHHNIALTLSFNFDGLGLYSKNPSQAGKVNAKVFLDNNGNQYYDDGDTPLPNVHFSVDGRTSEQVTDKTGEIDLDADANRQSVIKISPGVYGDYYWDVPMPERAVITRLGKPLILEFAARLNGEIEGMVYKTKQTLTPLSGVSLELLDDQGNIAMTVKSGFDGFYLFEKVPFGQYLVRVSPALLKQLNHQPIKALPVKVSKDNDIVSGLDFYLGHLATSVSNN